MSKLTLRALALAFALAAAPGPVVSGDAGAAEFVAGTVDLPMMPGLEGAADGPVVFDSPAGRIVESWASGAVSRDAVARFYAESLPQLGWRRQDDGTYRRESEVLTIETTSTAAGVAVRFQIAPGGAGEG